LTVAVADALRDGDVGDGLAGLLVADGHRHRTAGVAAVDGDVEAVAVHGDGLGVGERPERDPLVLDEHLFRAAADEGAKSRNRAGW